jgi:hypothetical protein
VLYGRFVCNGLATGRVVPIHRLVQTHPCRVHVGIGNTVGVTRDHGDKGAFVSKWIIKKSNLRVVSGSDLMQQVYLWDAGTQRSFASPA